MDAGPERQDFSGTQFRSSISNLDLKQFEGLLWFRVCRSFLQFSWFLNRTNISKIHGDGQCKVIKKLSLGAVLIRFFMLFVVVKLLVSTYNAYLFDLYRFAYSQYEHSSLGQANLTQDRQIQLKLKLEEARKNLIGNGVLYQNLSFFIEIWNLFLAASIFFLGFFMFIAFGHHVDIHYILGGIMMDPEAIKESYLRVVLKQVHTIIVSSENVHRDRMKLLASRVVSYQKRPGVFLMMNPQTWRNNEHQQLVNRLGSLLSTGQFGPLTWKYHWIERIGWINCWQIVLVLSYLIWSSLMLFLVVPMMTLASDETFDWWHLARMSDEIVAYNLTVLIAGFYVTILVVSSIDHTRHINKLIELITECKLKNDIQFRRIVWLSRLKPANVGYFGPQEKEINQQAGQLSDNLLLALVHYKISVALSRSMRKTSTVILTGALGLLFTLPLACLLHEPYIKDSIVRNSYFFICVSNTVAINCITVPLCCLNTRSFDLHLAMSSLLAHSVECQTFLDALEEPHIYDPHLVALLRKELNDPHKMASEFTTVAWAIPMTYPNLLRLHFWFGLIMLAVINGVNSRNGDLFGHFFTDPFELFAQRGAQ